jgi:hypothetical protein
MFQVETRTPGRPDELLRFHRQRGIPLPGLLLDSVLDGYDSHMVALNAIRGLAGTIAGQRLVEAADEVMTGEVLAIRIRGHADRVFIAGGRNTNDELRTSAARAVDVWRNLRANVSSRGFQTRQIIQVILEAMGAVEPRDTAALTSEQNRRAEIFLFDRFQPVFI